MRGPEARALGDFTAKITEFTPSSAYFLCGVRASNGLFRPAPPRAALRSAMLGSMDRRDFLKKTAFASIAAYSSLNTLGCSFARSGAPENEAHEPFASLRLRPANERGSFKLGWLDARYSFSFSDYRDPAHTRYRALRVLNEDRIAAGGGFPIHPHRDMEIVTYLLRGELTHRDTLGHGGTIKRGEVQRMSAGRGIRHSEFNHSGEETHLLQIWLFPDRAGDDPSYEESPLPPLGGGELIKIASPKGGGGIVSFGSDAHIYACEIGPGQSLSHHARGGRGVYLHLARGGVQVNGILMESGDAVYSLSEGAVELIAHEPSELLLFDLA